MSIEEFLKFLVSVVKFNRFVIVEFQFTFHYRDKCLGNDFKNLPFGKEHNKRFFPFVIILKISQRLDSL
jgi:hypothetical protein